MKKVALFVDDMNRHAFFERLSGIQERGQKLGLDLTLHVFHSRASFGLDPDYNTGEYNIFNLPDLQTYDGFILDLFNYYAEEGQWYGGDMCQRLVERVRKTGIPTVAIGNDIQGFPYVGIDNYPAMSSMMDHLVHKHGCQTFWFIMGPANNAENVLRVRACLDYVREHFHRDDSHCVYYENYEITTGKNGFLKLLGEFRELPDAIVCANDKIALGVAETAQKQGYHIPEDFLLTGFDNMDEAACMMPMLTTVDQQWIEPGRRSVDVLQCMWEGREIPPSFLHITAIPVFRGSCSCPDEDHALIRTLYNRRVFDNINREVFDSHINQLEYDLLRCETITELGECFCQSLFFLECNAFYLVLSEDISAIRSEDVWSGRSFDSASLAASHFPTEGYPDNMRMMFCYEDGEIKTDHPYMSSLFPGFEAEKGMQDYLFLTIHFKQYTIGYFAIRDAIRLMRNPYLSFAVRVLNTAIENLYTRSILYQYNQILSQTSIRDSMTGFYNRLGYKEKACRLFDQKRESGENLTILFIDMDRLKQLNDRYGHECGDHALQAISSAIRSVMSQYSQEQPLEIRMGGDEFLVILEEKPPQEISGILHSIEQKIPLMEESQTLPYAPGVSIGYITTDMSLDKNLDDYVREADTVMYRAKRSKQEYL